MKTSLRGDCSPAARLADAAPVVLFNSSERSAARLGRRPLEIVNYTGGEGRGSSWQGRAGASESVMLGGVCAGGGVLSAERGDAA